MAKTHAPRRVNILKARVISEKFINSQVKKKFDQLSLKMQVQISFLRRSVTDSMLLYVCYAIRNTRLDCKTILYVDAEILRIISKQRCIDIEDTHGGSKKCKFAAELIQ